MRTYGEREAVHPRYGLSSSSGSGSSTRPLCCVGIGTAQLKTASGTNENENYSFMWINSEARHPLEVRSPLSEIEPTDEDWDICYCTITPPDGLSCPAAKVSQLPLLAVRRFCGGLSVLLLDDGVWLFFGGGTHRAVLTFSRLYVNVTGTHLIKPLGKAIQDSNQLFPQLTTTLLVSWLSSAS